MIFFDALIWVSQSIGNLVGLPAGLTAVLIIGALWGLCSPRRLA